MISPLQATTMGFVLSAVNPKNLILTLAAATTIAATGLPGTDQVIAFLVYALIATIGVAMPVVIYFTMDDRSKPVLDDLKTWARAQQRRDHGGDLPRHRCEDPWSGYRRVRAGPGPNGVIPNRIVAAPPGPEHRSGT
jgi:hypothetical protein